MARAWWRWHHLGGRVRPVLGDTYIVGKGRWPAAAVRWDSKPPRPCSSGRGSGRTGTMTCGFFIPVGGRRARRHLLVADAVRPSAYQWTSQRRAVAPGTSAVRRVPQQPSSSWPSRRRRRGSRGAPPCQRSTAERSASQPFPRPCGSVHAVGMGESGSGLPRWSRR
jgi:hypothetical protein